MTAKVIDEIDIVYMCFSYTYVFLFSVYIVIMALGMKKKSRRKIWYREWLLKRNNRGVHNGILNKFRQGRFSKVSSYEY